MEPTSREPTIPARDLATYHGDETAPARSGRLQPTLAAANRRVEPLLDHPRRQLGLAKQDLLAERTPQQLGNVRLLHVPGEVAQQPKARYRPPEDAVEEEVQVALFAGVIDDLGGQHGGVDVRALEPLVPVPCVVDDAAFDVFGPQRRTAVGAQTIETEGVQSQPRREAEAL